MLKRTHPPVTAADEEVPAHIPPPGDEEVPPTSCPAVPSVAGPEATWWETLSATAKILSNMVPLSVSTADGIRQKVVSDLGRVKDAVYGGLGYAPRLMGLLVKLRGPRKEYARAAIETIVEIDKAVRQQGGTAADAASAVNLVPGFERVTRRQILRWKELLRAIAEGKPGGLRGRPTDKEFEERVFSKLVVLVATKRAPTTLTREEVVDVEDYERFPDDTGIDLRKVTTVKENIAYSYGMVAMAAERTQAEAAPKSSRRWRIRYSQLRSREPAGCRSG